MTSPIIRAARKDDSQNIARLFLMASGGLAEYIWRRYGGTTETDLIAIGAARYAREGVPFSYQNCTVAEAGGQCLGILHAFAMLPEDETEPEVDPVLKPYAEMEDYGSFYISGVAVYPEHRSRGIGQMLMAEAERQARVRGLNRLSLICFERNFGALKLYQRLGFVEKDRRPIVAHPYLEYSGGDAIMLHRHLD